MRTRKDWRIITAEVFTEDRNIAGACREYRRRYALTNGLEVNRFKRRVKAGGASVEVFVVVVRCPYVANDAATMAAFYASTASTVAPVATVVPATADRCEFTFANRADVQR